MNPELVFFTTFACPRCKFALEADSEGPPAWVRCPRCGRACLPPEIVRRPPSAADFEGAYPIGPEPVGAGPGPGLDPHRPRPMAAMPDPNPPRPSTLRLVLGAGFFLAILAAVFSLLGGEWARGAGFGVAAAVLLFLLARPGRAAAEE